jgi:hypothetical protein
LDFSLRHCVHTSSGAHQVTYPMDTGAFNSVIKRPECGADYSPLSNAEVKNAWSYTTTHQYAFVAWCLLNYGATLRYVTFMRLTLLFNDFFKLHYRI